MAHSYEKLFTEFPPVSTSQWEKMIEADLKGADYEKKLVWRSPDQLKVKPYYRSEDLESLPDNGMPGEYPYARGYNSSDNSWLVRQDIVFTSVKETSDMILNLADKDVQSFGISTTVDISKDDIIQFLSNLPLKNIELNFSGFDPFALIEAMDYLCRSENNSPADFRGSLGIDPLGDFVLSGKLGDEEKIFNNLAEVIMQTKAYTGVRVIEVHASHFHNAGATAIQSMAYALALANEYLVEMTERELDIEQIAPKFGFVFAVGSNYFFELAKFRSWRSIWSKVVESYGAKNSEAAKAHIHAETSQWNKTLYDPFVNLLRTTTEAMSSILGGIDSLTVRPFNEIYKEDDEFAQRLARNQQFLLRDEAYLDKVIDPAAGSYYIENLTDSLSHEAWKLFQDVEAKGGFTQAFLDGVIQDAITTIAQVRDDRIAHRKEVLLGTNQYPNIMESLDDSVDLSRVHPGVVDPSEADTQPLILYRGAEEFEKLRLQAEKSKKKPLVFLLTIGNLNMRKARAGFANSFFGCAGYRIIDNPGFSTIEEGIEKAIKAKADILVLCSSDEEYPALAQSVIASDFDGELVIAGYPKEQLDDLKKAGVKHFIHVKSDVLKTLQGFNKLFELVD